jgi:hypothetical protein
MRLSAYALQGIVAHVDEWQVEFTDQFGEWFAELTPADQNAVDLAVEALVVKGPGLGRPFVDTVTHSRHANMKELRPRGTAIRIFFAFDPRRMAVLLVGGDKRNRWTEFYQEMLPEADRLYDEHLDELWREGILK